MCVFLCCGVVAIVSWIDVCDDTCMYILSINIGLYWYNFVVLTQCSVCIASLSIWIRLVCIDHAARIAQIIIFLMLRFVCLECNHCLCCVAHNIYSEMIIIWCIHRYVRICMPWCGMVYCKVCIVCQQYMWSVPVRLFAYFALPYFVFALWMLF